MSSKRSKPEVRFRLRITKGEAIAIGPGKTDLLEAIARTGSLTSAAKSILRLAAGGSLEISTAAAVTNSGHKTPIIPKNQRRESKFIAAIDYANLRSNCIETPIIIMVLGAAQGNDIF